jgi:hypothetical protein
MQYSRYSGLDYNIPFPSRPQIHDQLGPAWESSLPWWPAFFRTTVQMLCHPGRTLAVKDFPGYMNLLAYSLPLLVFLGSITILYNSVFKKAAFTVSQLLTLPLNMIAYLLACACLFHFALLLVGGAKNGWQATFRAVSYLSAGCCLLLVPWLGPLLYIIWFIAAVFPALAASHAVSRLKVLASFCALIFVALVIFMIVVLIGEWTILLRLADALLIFKN